MSQENYFGAALKVALEKNPKLFDTSNLDEQLKQSANERAKLDAINDAARAKRTGEDKPVNEFNKLRRELYVLSERAKHTEGYCNNQAGEVKALEQRTTDAINQKKIFVASGNALAERFCEHQIRQLERELVDVKQEFQRARGVSAGAANDLKAWPHHERLKELQQEIA
jgi:hypothetical protein